MAAIYELVQLTLNVGNVGAMVEGQVMKDQIVKFMNNHESQLSLLKNISAILKTAFSDTVITDQISQMDLITADIFDQIAKNMVQLNTLSDDITNKYKTTDVKPYETQLMDQLLVGLGTVSSLANVTKFMVKHIENQFAQFKNPKQQLGVYLRKTRLRSYLNRFEGNYTKQKMQLALVRESQAIRRSVKDITLKNILKDAFKFANENPLTAAGAAFMGAIRILLFAASIYSFVQEAGNLEYLKTTFDELTKTIGKGGTIQKNQLALMQIIALIAANATNILYSGYAVVLDIRNSYQLLAISFPDLHNYFINKGKQFNAEEFVFGFNIDYIQSIEKISIEIYNEYVSRQKQYTEQKNKQQARKILIDGLTNMKEMLEKIEPTVGHKYSEITQSYAKKIYGYSIQLSNELKTDGNKMNNFRHFLGVVKIEFDNRSSKTPSDQKDSDPRLVSRIMWAYITQFINSRVSQNKLINQDDIDDIFKKAQNFEKASKEILQLDKYALENVVRYILSFSKQIFADDPTGKSLFAIPLSGLQASAPDKSSIFSKLSKLESLANIIPLLDEYSNEKKQPNLDAEKNGTLMSIDQLKQVLFKYYPKFNQQKKLYNIAWFKRCKVIDTTKKKQILIAKVNEQKEISMEKQNVSYIKFSRALAFQASQAAGNNQTPILHILMDTSQSYGQPSWILNKYNLSNTNSLQIQEIKPEFIKPTLLPNEKKVETQPVQTYTQPQNLSNPNSLKIQKIKPEFIKPTILPNEKKVETQPVQTYTQPQNPSIPKISVDQKIKPNSKKVETQPVYRYYAQQEDRRRYQYSLNPKLAKGWTLEGVAFEVPRKDDPLAVPIYEFHLANPDGWRFLYELAKQTPKGWIYDGSAFNVYTKGHNQSVPIHKFCAIYKEKPRYMYSTASDPIGKEWSYVSVAFWAFKGQLS